MLVYGDALRREAAADKLDRVRDSVGALAALAPGLARHSALVGALIEAGELAQGIADAEFSALGERDAASPAAVSAMALVSAIARCVVVSWSSGFAECRADAIGPWLDACAALLPTEPLEIRQPEGYAFYALYPECYIAAAQPLAGAGWQVVGIRSIGTSLAAVVAAALGAPSPLTLRPVGHPFDRRIDADLQPDPSARRIAVVDEGPGLSGSSMAAVATWLGEKAPQARRHFFPSHAGGPGARASATVQAVWAGTPRHVASFDDVVLRAALPAQRLETWVADRVGPLRAPLLDIGGGAWREPHACSGSDQPPVHAWQERRKYLAESAGGRWLVKFGGLGRIGERKLARARALYGAGFSPQPVGLCHGFLVERWRDDLTPLPASPTGALRQRLLQRLADYLGFRAVAFPAAVERGASLLQLHRMARHNTAEELGSGAAQAWDRWLPALAGLEARMHRVETDNRLQPWEWLHGGGDTVLKTDALDHHAGHDLIGCQDIAWDVAGAIVEFDLDADEAARLAEGVALRSERAVDDGLLAWMRPCYLAFQLGYWREAESACGDGVEAARLRAAGDRHAARLSRTLAGPAFRSPKH